MEGTADVHHDSADALFPEAEPVFDDATALHAPVDVLDPEPSTVQGLVTHVLLPCQLLATRFLGRHEDVHLGQRERQEAQILQQLLTLVCHFKKVMHRVWAYFQARLAFTMAAFNGWLSGTASCLT